MECLETKVNKKVPVSVKELESFESMIGIKSKRLLALPWNGSLERELNRQAMERSNWGAKRNEAGVLYKVRGIDGRYDTILLKQDQRMWNYY